MTTTIDDEVVRQEYDLLRNSSHLCDTPSVTGRVIALRYRSYFRSSSKLVSHDSCHRNMCSFNSLVSIVSKCSKEFAKNILDASKGSNHAAPCCRKHHKSPNEIGSQNAQTLSRNIMKPDFPDEQYVEQQSRKKMYRGDSSAVNNEDEEIPSESRTERLIDGTISSDRSNASGDAYSNYYDSPIPVAKRSICVQTSRKTKSRRKDSRQKKKRESNRKDNNSVLDSTEMPSSRDIQTIFRTNSKDFNREESNMNLDLLETRGRKTEGKSCSNTLPDEKGNDDFTMIYQKCAERNRSASTRTETILTNEFYKNIETSDNETTINPAQFKRNNSPPLNGREGVFLANSIETLCDSASLYEIANVSQTPRDFPSEDKSSETIILGNIKKRLEEDYDDYFSFDEFEVFETWPKLTPKINRTSSDSTIDYYVRDQRSETAALPMQTGNESLTEYRKAKHSVKGVHRDRKESLQANNLTYSFSIHCTNSNLSHSQSSYYTPSQEQDVSPCSSSVEYCSASNNSSSIFSRAGPHFNLLATRQTPQSSVAYNCALETSPLSDDHILSESNRIFQNGSERFSETQIRRRRRRRRRRSSSTRNMSKLITESFDSGVLTDYSRDHLLSSSERSGNARRPIDRSDRSCCFAREPSSLPTYDFDLDSSYSDDSLNRRLEVAVKQFTEDLVLTERKVRLKLRRLENPSRSRQYTRRRPRRLQVGTQE
ncbi:uncharacterized protein LOC143215938 isoform X2 [Lasioglossum baleicum]|uniref:uncharacterized protein LOC143215938 isoform X2 n=1 Tax=Lasioglossum baleicum TaxID=434251 RepID=UPI003FCC9DCE